ncbi:PilN domain-containing protein [Gemmatimonas groenlandica]|uniref:PilN domain-containing protein n=1 Tax=Gemmatimonas groenlandica TaxID=2732249 RepID=A0A6M4IPI0_9BACT|nr:PilN domain-containing protein [Gemmatimonas groenlandica]QJR35659.1 PilN domain-containing protein [Gemmatimonas groenlandica]
MSRPLCLLLDGEFVSALPRDGAATATRVAWRPEAPLPMVESLRSAFGAPTGLVVIVGLAFLEIAEPQLPPVPNDARVRMLQRDSDRYFALREPAAVATDGSVAFAMSSALLTSWLDALSAWSPVRAVVTVAAAAALGGHDGRWTADAGDGSTGQLTIREGRVQSARRLRGGGDAAERPLTIAELTGGAWRAAAGTLDLQLLDSAMRERAQRQRARRWWQSAVFAAAALVLLAWSVDRWRERQLVALQQEAQTLEQSTAGARAAQQRLLRAQGEQTAIAAADRRAVLADAPPAVLARLGELLPRDAFIQRLEWNGTEWRIDGSANDAAALVPLLDADAQLVGVRAAAPSMRFLENGRSRSSFSIVFQTLGAPAPTRGGQ